MVFYSKYIQKTHQIYSKPNQSKDGYHAKFLLIKIKSKTAFILSSKFPPLLLKFSLILYPEETRSRKIVKHILAVVDKIILVSLTLLWEQVLNS